MRRVVITGMGALTPIGNNVADFWQGAKNGECGIDEITLYDTTGQKVSLAAEVKGLDITEYIPKQEVKRLDKFSQFAIVAADEAFKQSGIDFEKQDAKRCGVIIGSGIGGLKTTADGQVRGMEKGFDRVSPFFIPSAIINLAAGNVAIRHGIKGMCSAAVTACAAGTNAIGDGFHYVRDGYAEMMLVGGAEAAITPLGMGGFTAIQALNTGKDKTRASIPFDAERSGFVMGEGAGVLVLEEYEHAKARGAKILGEIVGYGATCDANHITAPHPEGEGAMNSMLCAVEDAKISPEDVGYINAHGTSTPMNDKLETLAIHRAFGKHAKNLKVSSTKSMTGHLLGASGAIEAILTVKAIEEGFIPPTVGYKVPDENCDLDIVPNNGVKFNVEYAMSNSLGFGGHNATLVFKKIV